MTTSKKSLSDQFQWNSIPAMIVAIGAASIALSVSREIGFFHQIDTRLLATMSLEDVISNSLYVTPITLFCWFIGTVSAKTDIELPGTQTARRVLTFDDPAFELKLGGGIIVFIILVFPQWPMMVLFNSFITYAAFVAWVRSRHELSENTLAPDLLFGIFLMFQAFLVGATEGRAVVLSERYEYRLSLNSENAEKVQLLRTTQNWIIYKNTDGKIGAHARAAEQRIELLERPEHSAIIPIFNYIRLAWDWLWMSQSTSIQIAPSGSFPR